MIDRKIGDIVPAAQVDELPQGAVVLVEWLPDGPFDDPGLGSGVLLHCGSGVWLDDDDNLTTEGAPGGSAYRGAGAQYHVIWLPPADAHPHPTVIA